MAFFRLNKLGLTGLSIAGLALFLYYFPRVYPEAGLDMPVDRTHIETIGRNIAENMGAEISGFYLDQKIEKDLPMLRYLTRAYGPGHTNRLIADSSAGYQWVLTWSSERPENVQYGGSGDVETSERGEQPRDQVKLTLDMKGMPVSYANRVRIELSPDTSLTLSSMGVQDSLLAADLARELTLLYGGNWKLHQEEETVRRPGFMRMRRWDREQKWLGTQVYLEVQFRRGELAGFRRNTEIPEPYRNLKPFNFDYSPMVVIIFFIVTVVFFISRLRNDLLDLKSGLVIALVAAAGHCLTQWLELSQILNTGWTLLAISLTAPFVAGGLWAVFAVGESLTREVWSEKLHSFDVLRRRIWTSTLGHTLLRGLALSWMLAGLIAFLDYLAVRFLSGSFTLRDASYTFWNTSLPSADVIGKTLRSSIYIAVIFCLFLGSLIRRKVKKPVLEIPIIILLWSLVSLSIPRLESLWLQMTVSGLVGILIMVFFWRFDFLTVLTGMMTLPVLFYGITSFSAGGYFNLHGWILCGILGMILVSGILTSFSSAVHVDSQKYVPDYLQRIYERERIQKELEIARRIQVNFLPRQIPKIANLDIASFCLPAKEVGGDYYDFIVLGPRKLGVVIGDVSGKGIPAAFYMTLTKGFILGQAHDLSSPAHTLVHINHLFYENAERGIFISMIYGVFDLEKNILTFARAGHNPMILRRPTKGSTEILDPPGIALGLEKGELFAKTIKESTIPLHKQDVFLFYTDGLNEAQDPKREEFEEKRLTRIIETHHTRPAESILQELQQEIEVFVAGAPQHDDMTAVIVKII